MEYNNDYKFLEQLNQQQQREVYIRIISLTNDEYPRERIEGRATGGSINIDGSSVIRRSCSLSMSVLDNDIIITDKYWCFNNKFKLQVGLRNLINSSYPEIIWIDKGIYIITSFNISRSATSLNISLQGRDKMCRLNGEVSGSLPMGNDLGTEETVRDVRMKDSKGNYTGKISQQVNIKKIPLSKIIRCAVKEYAQERDDNIIINDLPEEGYELWDYRGDVPMYLFIKALGENKVPQSSAELEYINLTFNGDIVLDGIALKDIQHYFTFNFLNSDINNKCKPLWYGKDQNGEDQWVVIAKVVYGDTAGYHATPLVYSGDLILKAGDPITAMLDKIKNMLGDFEYFYDLQGRFIFQKKKTYIQELFSPLDGNQQIPIAIASPYSYKFEDMSLVTSISNSPNINNAKNEFVVWGARKGALNGDLPIHARYAIQKKPEYYKSPYDRMERIRNIGYMKQVEIVDTNYLTQEYFIKNENGEYIRYTPNDNSENITLYALTTMIDGIEDKTLYQWDGTQNKAIIFNKENKFYKPIEVVVEQGDLSQYKPCDTEEHEVDLTQYYYYNLIPKHKEYKNTDYDWRELIYQMAIDYYAHNLEINFLAELATCNSQFIGGRTGYEQYYSDLQRYWRQLYNPNPSLDDIQYNGEYYLEQDNNKYWNKIIHTDPSQLDFWFDFLDVNGEISNYSVDKIGTRRKVVNETSLKSIYYKAIPEIQFLIYPKDNIRSFDDNGQTSGMNLDKLIIQENMENLFYRSSQGSSIIDKVNSLINQHAMQIAGISLTTIPIYFLEPNTRIYVAGYGDYTLDKITLPLNYDAKMSLSCTKIMTSII